MKTTNEQVKQALTWADDAQGLYHSYDPVEVHPDIRNGIILAAEVGRLQAERDQWKANHDNQMKLKRILMDRPDLGDRAASMRALIVECAELRKQSQMDTTRFTEMQSSGQSLECEIAALRAKVAELEAYGANADFNFNDQRALKEAAEARVTELEGYNVELATESQQLQVRVERLETALRRISDGDESGEWAEEIATAALAGQPEATAQTDHNGQPMTYWGGMAAKTDYRTAAPGTFGRAEWLDLLMACQDGRATCLRVVEIIEREMGLQRPAVTNEMVSRFLCWRFPATFNPDGGISFDKKDRDPNSHWWPVGTNLLCADEARQMIERILRPDAAMAANGGDAK